MTARKEFIILGGGQDARDVTTTSSRQGKFEARFFHKIFEDEIGRVRGHFGPLNTVSPPPPWGLRGPLLTDKKIKVAAHPLGNGYASGGEDGYVRVHHFDKPYFEFKYEVEKMARV